MCVILHAKITYGKWVKIMAGIFINQFIVQRISDLRKLMDISKQNYSNLPRII